MDTPVLNQDPLLANSRLNSEFLPADRTPIEQGVREKFKRKENTTFGQQVGAMFAQDNTLDGLVASAVGNQMLPEGGFNAAADPTYWKDITEGVNPEYHHELAGATSKAHGMYTKMRLLKKQEELQILNDLSTMGNVGRFGFGFLHGIVDPINVPMMVMGNPMGFAAKVATGVAGGVGQEMVRQSVNYENDKAQLLDAGLTAGLFSLPFAALGAQGEKVHARLMAEQRATTAKSAADQAAAGIRQDLISQEQRATYRGAFDLADEIEGIRAEAEKAHAWGRAEGEGLDLNLDATDPKSALQRRKDAAKDTVGETPLDVSLVPPEGPAKTAMQLAMEKAGLAQERYAAADVERTAAERDTAMKVAAAETAKVEQSWKQFFAAAADDVMLKASNMLGSLLDPAGRPKDATKVPRSLDEVRAELPLIEKLKQAVHAKLSGGDAEFSPRPLLHVDEGLRKLASDYATNFGRKLVFYHDITGKNKVDGVYGGDNVLYIRADVPRVAERVAMHEFFHSLRSANEGAYQQFMAGINKAVTGIPEFHALLKEHYTKKGIALPTPDKMTEELMAELAERMVRDPRMAELISHYQEARGPIMRSLVSLLDWLGSWVRKLAGGIDHLPENPALAKHVSDLNQFRRSLAKFIAVAGKGEDGKLDVSFSTGVLRDAAPEMPKAARVPTKTVKAYKLFRVDPKHPGQLFPLFVNANKAVPVGQWVDAEIGPQNAKGGVKSKIGDLAFRPGWHAGDVPVATHIGGKSSADKKAPDVRPSNQVWAEVEMSADVDWQAEATRRGTNTSGKLVPAKAHITDQMPVGGHYRYKTNSNMTGNWLIGGEMRVNRVLTDAEVAAVNGEAGLADLPRAEPAMWDHSTPEQKAAKDAMFSTGVLTSALNAPVLGPSQPAGSTPFQAARLDYGATIMKGKNETLKNIFNKLARDVIGEGQGWTASEWATKVMRAALNPAHVSMGQEYNKAAHALGWGWWKRNDYDHQVRFFEVLSEVKRGDTHSIDVGGEFHAAAAEVKAAVAASDKAYKQLLKEAREAGVEGAENIPDDPKYVNRMWSQTKIKQMVEKHGAANVVAMLAHSFDNPVLKGNLEKAEGFLNAVMRLEYTNVLQDAHLLGKDMKRLRWELEQANLSPSEVDAVVDVMMGVKSSQEADAGRPANLKYRMGIEEAYEHKLPNGEVIRITGMFENDMRVLMDTYGRSMAGYTGLAKVGYTSRSVFDEHMRLAMNEHEASGEALRSDSSEYKRNSQHVRDLWDVITGRPMSHQTFNRLDRSLIALRGFTRGAMLGQLGIAQALEISNVMGMVGVKASLHHMPSLGGLIKQIREGRISLDDLQQDIEHMFGVGLEHGAAHMRQNEMTEFTYDRALTGVERAANRVSHGVDIVSGNRLMTSLTRAYATRMVIQKIFDVAHGKDSMSLQRFNSLGIDATSVQPFLADMRSFAQMDKRGTVTGVDWENWKQTNPQSFDQFQLAVMRKVRDGIQDHDIGETMPWMHTQLGKVFSELRTFMLVAHAKQFLKNVHYMDRETLGIFVFGTVAQTIGYVMQATLNNAGNQEKLDKALEPERIGKAVIQRVSAYGLLPAIVESGYYAGSGGSSFLQGGSVNTDSRNLFVTPSLTMLGRAVDAAKVAGGAVNPWSDAVNTQKEVKSAWGLLPGGNTYLMRNTIDHLVSDLPRSEPFKRQ